MMPYTTCALGESGASSGPVRRRLQWGSEQDSLAEWSKALASGASPQGRGFKPHSCHACSGDDPVSKFNSHTLCCGTRECT